MMVDCAARKGERGKELSDDASKVDDGGVLFILSLIVGEARVSLEVSSVSRSMLVDALFAAPFFYKRGKRGREIDGRRGD